MREAAQLRQVDVTWVLHEGERLSYFGGSDYLRISWHPAVRKACAKAVHEFGLSAGASRVTTGNVPIYPRVEAELATFFGMRAATLTSSGYLAPMVAAQAIGPDHTHALLDARAHACLSDAAALTGLPTLEFPHCDPEGLDAAVRKLGSQARPLVFTDGLFSHTGQVAPLREYLRVLPSTATLLVDDAHGAGILGEHGRGSLEHADIPTRGVVLAITLSKVFGCYGGAVLGSTKLRDSLFDRSRILIGNTPPPPPLIAGVLAALEVLGNEGAERRERLRAHSSFVMDAAREVGAPIAPRPGPMFSIAPEGEGEVNRLRRMLLRAGIYPPLITYPNGPAGRYFRFAISSEHTTDQLTTLRDVLCTFYRGSG